MSTYSGYDTDRPTGKAVSRDRFSIIERGKSLVASQDVLPTVPFGVRVRTGLTSSHRPPRGIVCGPRDRPQSRLYKTNKWLQRLPSSRTYGESINGCRERTCSTDHALSQGSASRSWITCGATGTLPPFICDPSRFLHHQQMSAVASIGGINKWLRYTARRGNSLSRVLHADTSWELIASLREGKLFVSTTDLLWISQSSRL